MLRIAGCVLLFAAVAPLHIITKRIIGRSRWSQRFLAGVTWLLGVRVHLTGFLPNTGTLLVANHTSWLDILILGGKVGSAFVSKDELGHGFIHWLANQNATVYVKRGDRQGARKQAVAIAEALKRQQPITVFPEGTTGPGTRLLPFRSTLLEAAKLAGLRTQVRPIAIDYGKARAEVGWFDEEPGKDNVIRILNRAGKLRVTVHMLGPLAGSTDRKQLTAQAAEAIASTLGFKSPAHSSMSVGE